MVVVKFLCGKFLVHQLMEFI